MMRRSFSAALTLALVAISIAAEAGPPRGTKASPKAPPKPALPAPSVKMTLDRDSSEGQWTLRVENTGQVPWRLAADARFLALDITPPASATPPPPAPTKKAARGRAHAANGVVHCSLPSDMRPDPEDRALVVPPGRAFVTTFSPELYCFGARETAALVPGASVVARLGWATHGHSSSTSGPFAIEPLPIFTAGDPNAIGPASEIVADAWTIPQRDESTAPAPPPDAGSTNDPAADGADDPASLKLTLPARAEEERGVEVSTEVTVTNTGRHATTFSFRPETMVFRVERPDGTTLKCAWVPEVSPIRETLTTLGPRASASLSVLVSALCSDRNAFAIEGIYRVYATLDTRRASGRAIGVRTFEGQVKDETPLLVRVHQPRTTRLEPRPKLVDN